MAKTTNVHLTKHGMQSITAWKNDTIQAADSKHFKVEFIRDQVILSAYHFSSMKQHLDK